MSFCLSTIMFTVAVLRGDAGVDPFAVDGPPDATPVSNDSTAAVASSDASVSKREPTSSVRTWNESLVLDAGVGPIYYEMDRDTDGVDESVWQASRAPYLTIGLTRPLHRLLVAGGRIGVTGWSLDNAASSGYRSFWAIDVSAVPALRVPLGRRGRTGFLFGAPMGLTLDIAPTRDELLAVQEQAGLGLGWHAGLDLGYYFFFSSRLGLAIHTAGSRQQFRHKWRFSTPDGTLDRHTQITRYQSWRVGASLAVLVTF